MTVVFFQFIDSPPTGSRLPLLLLRDQLQFNCCFFKCKHSLFSGLFSDFLFFFRVLQFHYDVFWWGFLFIDPAWDSLGFRKCELGLPSVLEYTHEHLSACCFLLPFSPSPPSVLLYLRWTSHCNFQVS